MKIKESREFKLPQIMFDTVWGNFMFIILLAVMFINIVTYMVDYPSMELIPLGLIIFGIIALYILIVGSIGEAFSKEASKANFSDLKRSAVYILITFLVFVGIGYYHSVNKVIAPPEKLVTEQSIKITELTIFDIHKSKISKILFAIGYKDSNGYTRWQSNFTELQDRTQYLETLVKDDKFKVEINFKIDKHNHGSLEIIKHTIKG